jgi:hypothetical protein
MRHTTLVFALILASSPLVHATNLRVQQGRPIVDGVYVNGHGPFRFLVDTGSNVNLIDAKLARSIALTATFQVELASANGNTPVSGSDGNEIALDEGKADGQKFLFSTLDAVHSFFPDIQGVLGQWFLSRFDYLLDLQGKKLTFGRQDRNGTRIPFKMINGRMAVSANLGNLILDSGASRLVLFGVQPDAGQDTRHEYRTVAGSQKIGMQFNRELLLAGRRVWRGDAVALPQRNEPGVDGLLPVSFFKTIYVCNSENDLILD